MNKQFIKKFILSGLILGSFFSPLKSAQNDSLETHIDLSLFNIKIKKKKIQEQDLLPSIKIDNQSLQYLEQFNDQLIAFGKIDSALDLINKTQQHIDKIEEKQIFKYDYNTIVSLIMKSVLYYYVDSFEKTEDISYVVVPKMIEYLNKYDNIETKEIFVQMSLYYMQSLISNNSIPKNFKKELNIKIQKSIEELTKATLLKRLSNNKKYMHLFLDNYYSYLKSLIFSNDIKIISKKYKALKEFMKTNSNFLSKIEKINSYKFLIEYYYANALFQKGKYKEAIIYYGYLIRDFDFLKRSDNFTLTKILFNTAKSYYYQKQYQKALKLFNLAQNFYEKSKPKKHIIFISMPIHILLYKGNVYKNINQPKKALNLFLQTAKILKENIKKEDFAFKKKLELILATTYDNIANYYFSESERIKTVIYNNIEGAEAYTLSDVIKNKKEAIKYYEMSYKIKKRILGADNVLTQATKSNIKYIKNELNSE